MKITEIMAPHLTLFHGTCKDSAAKILKYGWSPHSGSVGGNMGQTKYLYLTNNPEHARWFAEEKGCNIIIKVSHIPIDFLKVDPEDGIADTVEDELNSAHGLPGNVVLFKALSPDHFSMY